MKEQTREEQTREEQMDKYKGFCISEYVELIEPVFCDGKNFHKDDVFRIISFPPCTIYGKHTHFVYGKDNQENPVRVDIDKIRKTGQS